MFSNNQIAALKAPLDANRVATRSQAGRELSYIEGWWAISEANRIFGFDAWDRETVDLRVVAEPREVEGKWRVAYMARVKVTVRTSDRPITREGCGYGSGIDRDVGSAHESALKEAETDAMKRALMTFGNPFGLALYDKTQANVATLPQRKSAAQAKRDGDHETVIAAIKACKTEAELDAWYRGFDAVTAHLPFSWLDPMRDEVEKQRNELLDAIAAAEAA